jgi:hypothetical protein
LSLRARGLVKPLAGQRERGAAGRIPGHGGRVTALPDEAVDDPHLERVVEAVPDVPVTEFVAAQARHLAIPADPSGFPSASPCRVTTRSGGLSAKHFDQSHESGDPRAESTWSVSTAR